MSSLPVDIASDSSSLLQDLRNADEDDFVGGEMLVGEIIFNTLVLKVWHFSIIV